MEVVAEQQSEQSLLETLTDNQITVTSTTLDTTSKSDDTTIQDVMISPDSDSPNMSLVHRTDYATKTENSKSSGSNNSIASSDSIVSDTLDSKSITVKHSESEIGEELAHHLRLIINGL